MVVLGLGSNKNYIDPCGNVFEPIQILTEAVKELSLLLDNILVSSVYSSAPMYYEKQENFFNMVVAGDYKGTPENLLIDINKIEAKWGRYRPNEIPNGPRSLDIDIELFDNLIVNTSKLTIPHKKIAEREFVLLPLLEILPESTDITSGQSFADIYANLAPQNVHKIAEVDYGRTSNDSNRKK